MLKYWQEFLQLEYANEILLIVGALVVGISLLQIVFSSIKMLFWLLLTGVGAATAGYGLQQKGLYDIPALDKLQEVNLNALASTMDADVLEFLCQKVDKTENPPQAVE